MLFPWFILNIFAIHFNAFRAELLKSSTTEKTGVMLVMQVAMEKLDLNWTRYRVHSVALSWGDKLGMLKLNERSSRISVLLEQDIFDIFKA